jgi:hypothetical protein
LKCFIGGFPFLPLRGYLTTGQFDGQGEHATGTLAHRSAGFRNDR